MIKNGMRPVVRKRRGVSADTAMRLARQFGGDGRCPFQPKLIGLTHIGRKTATHSTHGPEPRVRASDGSEG